MDSIHRLLSAALAELGLPAVTDFLQTTLLRNGYFAGWKFRYDGGYAIVPADGNMIEFFNDQGSSVKKVPLQTAQSQAA
jgi:hypothetical protein